MNKMQKDAIYDEMCKILTDYEVPEDGQDPVTEDDLYSMLVKIQNNWDELTSEE